MIGPELFWPQHAGNQTPYWPNLTEINLKYAPATPSGTWLFERDPRWKDLTPDYDDDPPRADGPGSNAINRFRTVANGDINELYVAAGLAAQQMPRLRNMTLCADIRDSGEGLGPVIDGDIQHWFKYNSRLARVTWVSNTKFHVAPEVREVWNAVAQSHGHDHVTIEVCISR
jgi:hypothetical protein